MAMKWLLSKFGQSLNGNPSSEASSRLVSSPHSSIFGTSLAECIDNDRVRAYQQQQPTFKSKIAVSSRNSSVFALDATSATLGMESKIETGGPTLGLVDKMHHSLTQNVPVILQQCIQFLDTDTGLSTPGLFRIAASSKDVKQQWMRELTDKIVPVYLFEEFSQAGDSIEKIQAAVALLPIFHRCTLIYLCRFLVRLSSQSDINKMTISNIAIVFGPTVFSFPSEKCTITLAPTNITAVSTLSKISTPIPPVNSEAALVENMTSVRVMSVLLEKFALWSSDWQSAISLGQAQKEPSSIINHTVTMRSVSVTSTDSSRSTPEKCDIQTISQKKSLHSLVVGSSELILFGISKADKTLAIQTTSSYTVNQVHDIPSIGDSQYVHLDADHVKERNSDNRDVIRGPVKLDEFQNIKFQQEASHYNDTKKSRLWTESHSLNSYDSPSTSFKYLDNYTKILKKRPRRPGFRPEGGSQYYSNEVLSLQESDNIQVIPTVAIKSSRAVSCRFSQPSPLGLKFESIQNSPTNSITSDSRTPSRALDQQQTNQQYTLFIYPHNNTLVIRKRQSDQNLEKVPRSNSSKSILAELPILNQETVLASGVFNYGPNEEATIIGSVPEFHSESHDRAFSSLQSSSPENRLGTLWRPLTPGILDSPKIAFQKRRDDIFPDEFASTQHTLGDTLVSGIESIVSPITPISNLAVVHSLQLSVATRPLNSIVPSHCASPGSLNEIDFSLSTQSLHTTSDYKLPIRMKSIRNSPLNHIYGFSRHVPLTATSYIFPSDIGMSSLTHPTPPPLQLNPTFLRRHIRQSSSFLSPTGAFVTPLTTSPKTPDPESPRRSPRNFIGRNGERYTSTDLQRIKDEYKILQQRVYLARSTEDDHNKIPQHDYDRYNALKNIVRELQKQSSIVTPCTEIPTNGLEISPTSDILPNYKSSHQPSLSESPSTYQNTVEFPAKAALEAIRIRRILENCPFDVEKMTSDQILHEMYILKSELVKLKAYYSKKKLDIDKNRITMEEKVVMKTLFSWYSDLKLKQKIVKAPQISISKG
ncbi:hypothetical protein BASA61_003896 [Batrachochytrium salamandrivorans]|nr:hypothetical protein BASA61_003896 [Batrachochytrium salamandrivorans]